MRYTATPTHYICNGGLGDVVASSAVIKYAIENFHLDGKYLVSTVPAYRDIFWFVPDRKFNNIFERFIFDEPYREARIFPLGAIEVPKSSLFKVASYNLINKVLRDEDYEYPKYPHPIDVSRFNLDIKKCVIISVGFRSPIRRWDVQILKKLTEWIVNRGYIPVLTGTEKEPFDPKSPLVKYNIDEAAKVVNVSDITTCINLIEQTSIKEFIGLCQQAACMVGYDGGPIHLAGLTDIPIVGAYTYVNPEFRTFVRHGKMGWNMFPVTPTEKQCRFCYTDWHLFNHNFNDCWTGTLECCNLRLEQFTDHLDKILT